MKEFFHSEIEWDNETWSLFEGETSEGQNFLSSIIGYWGSLLLVLTALVD
mgnify:CR=1 FL=1